MSRFMIFTTIWFLCSSLFYADCNTQPKGVFAVNISLQGDGLLYHVKAYCITGERITNTSYLTKHEFINYASGYWPSAYNPERINYLEQYDLNCGYIIDEFTRKPVYGCMPLDSLWKLSHSIYPYAGVMEPGWAGTENGPTEGQRKYLNERYNISNFKLDYIADTNLYKLLHDVMDSSWVANYKYM
jgi:hypothetical protein